MRTIVVTLSAAVLVVATASASAAGGVSWFEFDDEHVVVGEPVIGQANFYAGVSGTGRIEDGPWYAYLLPERTWIEPPDIPQGSIPLGQIAIEDHGATAIASITFTVPNVPFGRHDIGLCNLPCTESMVGDLNGGGLWIAGTEEGASLLRELNDSRGDLRRVRSRLSRRIRTAQRPFETLTERVDGMEGSVELRLSRLEDRLRAVLADRENEGPPWVTAAFAAAVVAAAVVLLVRGRGRGRPEPAPQEPPVVEWVVPEEVSART